MSKWLILVLPMLAAAALLVLPGVAIGAAGRLRGLLLIGVAPAVSAATLAIAAVTADRIGVRWGVFPVIATAALLAAASFVAGRMAQAPVVPVRPPRAWRSIATMAVGMAAGSAAALQALRTVRAVGDPEAIAQSFDTPFHHAATAYILQTGNASALGMSFASADGSDIFYPNTWHALSALLVELTGVSVPAAFNALMLVVSLVVWPLGVLAVARAVFGPRLLPLTAAAALAFVFAQFPNRLMSFGILYPNLLGYALLPGALALLIVLTRAQVRSIAPLCLLLGTASLGVAVAHPNAAIALAFVAVPLVVVTLVQGSIRRWRSGLSRWVIPVGWAAALLAGVGLYGATELLDMRQRAIWAISTDPGSAVTAVLDLSTPSPPILGQPGPVGLAQPVLAALVLVGAIAALRVRAWRWLPLGYGLLAALWIVTVAWDHPWRALLTGYWYADSIRLSSLLPLLGVPLAALGLATLVRLFLPVLRGRGLRRHRQVLAAATILVVAMAGSLGAGRLPAMRQSFETIGWMFAWRPPAEPTLLDLDERAFLENLTQDELPADALVLTNPWDGGALIWSLRGNPTVYSNLGRPLSPAEALVAERLVDANEDPAICPALEEIGAEYVLIFGPSLWASGDPSEPSYGFPGLYGLEAAGVAEVVAMDDDNVLLRVTACDA